jgi:putative hemolysin
MIYTELLAILLLIVLNGLLAMSELAIVSSRRSRLESMAADGNRGARAAIALVDDPGRFLSTVQIGITLVGIIAGAFGGATLGQRLGDWLDGYAWIAPHGTSVGFGVTVAILTYLSVIAGELVPKRVALVDPERVAAMVARPMRALSGIAAPVVWALHASTEAALKLLGLAGPRESTVTEDEVKSLIAEGTLAGIFVQQEKEMIDGVLGLDDRTVRVIMTPRARIVWLDVNAGRGAIVDLVQAHRFSRLLVCDGSVDRPLGFIHTKNLLAEIVKPTELRIPELVTPLMYIPDMTTILKLLNRFRNEKVHLAVVVDEYGTTAGLVTLTDVIEAIAGDLPERGDASEPGMVRRDDGSWLVDGATPTDSVAAMLAIDLGDEVQLLAGFVLEHLGRIPRTGESFMHGGTRFEIVDMDGNRIDKVLIRSPEWPSE